MRSGIAALDVILEPIHQLAPGRVAHRVEVGDRLPAALRETQHGDTVFARDVPGEGRSVPFRMVAMARPDDFFAGLKPLDHHAEDKFPLLEPELRLPADFLISLGIRRPPAAQARLGSDRGVDFVGRSGDRYLMLDLGHESLSLWRARDILRI